MKITKDLFFLPLSLAVFGVLLSGCPKAKGPAVEPEKAEEIQAEVEPAPAPLGPTLNIGTEFSGAPGVLAAVNFDYMSAELSPEARAALKKNAATLKAVQKAASGLKVRVEGHCDDRGTLEYNMALGERRAKAVKDYYATLGVAKSSLDTLSYGEERPVCSEAAEDCWARNRRGETTVKASQPIVVPVP
ncbi:MAG: OmpA family protein [Elusimicrobia bacterium]|nr:OmpA family protein [Elusimicrobiota bacterium]MBP9127596.1 OmpA family protein [Elusimicrobiota bacterium]MBP9699169.1 OmpA family protein [Elusimicrobiota bacterium]